MYVVLRSSSSKRSSSIDLPLPVVSCRYCVALFIVILTIESSVAAMQTPTATARAAIAQLRSTSDKVQNLIDCAKCAGRAKRHGASMVFLPECFGFLSSGGQQTLDNAEPPISKSAGGERPKGPVFDALKDTVSSYACGSDQAPEVSGGGNHDISLLDGLKAIARESGCWISAGGMHESGAPPALASTEEGGGTVKTSRVYNSHVIIDCDGHVKATYRKSHLFDLSIPGKVNLRESATTAPGNELVVCDSPIGRLGLSTCYDVRFPEMYVELVQRGGAEILLVPSAFTIPTGKAHWHTLLQARAIENQCYVLASAQVGKHNEKRMSYGHSIAIDPWGEIIADAGGYDGDGTTTGTAINDNCGGEEQVDHQHLSPVQVPSIILCDIDSEKIKSVRDRMPIQQHRANASFLGEVSICNK